IWSRPMITASRAVIHSRSACLLGYSSASAERMGLGRPIATYLPRPIFPCLCRTPDLCTDCVNAYFDRFRPPQNVVRIVETHAFEQLLRVVVSDPMSGDNRWQAQRIESMGEHCAQSLLTQPVPPGRPHEVAASLDCFWVHLPWPQAGTTGKLACFAYKHRPVLHPEMGLTFTFCMKPVMCLVSGHRDAEVMRHFRIAPQRFGKPEIFVSPAAKCQTSR